MSANSTTMEPAHFVVSECPRPSTNAIITHAEDIGEEVTSKFTPLPKKTFWAKFRTLLCGMQDGTILHSEKIESIPDLVLFEKADILKKCRIGA